MILIKTFLFFCNLAIDIWSFLLVLRFLLQLVKADYYHPMVQILIVLTDPIIKPLRRIVPMNRWDWVCLLAVFLLGIIRYLLTILLIGSNILPPLVVIILIFIKIVAIIVQIYLFSILFSAAFKWLQDKKNLNGFNLSNDLFEKLNQPILKRTKYFLSFRGRDYSVIALSIILAMLTILLSSFTPPLLF